MKRNSLSNKLSIEDNFIKVYKFTFELGSKLDVVLSALINAETWVDQGLSDDPDFFRCNVQGFMSNLLTGYSDYEIRSSINRLCDLGLIFKRSVNIGGEKSLFIKLNHDAILAFKEKAENKRYKQDDSKDKIQIVSRSSTAEATNVI